MSPDASLLLWVSLVMLIFGPGPAYLIHVTSAYAASGMLFFGMWVGFTGLLGLATICCLSSDSGPERPTTPPPDEPTNQPQEKITGPAGLQLFYWSFIVSVFAAFGALIHGFTMVLSYNSHKRQYDDYKDPAYNTGGVLSMIYSVILGAIEIGLLWFVSKRLGEYSALNPPPPTATETAPIIAAGVCPNPAVHQCPDPAAHGHAATHQHVHQDTRNWPSGPSVNRQEEEPFIPMANVQKRDFPDSDPPPSYLTVVRQEH